MDYGVNEKMGRIFLDIGEGICGRPARLFLGVGCEGGGSVAVDGDFQGDIRQARQLFEGDQPAFIIGGGNTDPTVRGFDSLLPFLTLPVAVRQGLSVLGTLVDVLTRGEPFVGRLGGSHFQWMISIWSGCRLPFREGRREHAYGIWLSMNVSRLVLIVRHSLTDGMT